MMRPFVVSVLGDDRAGLVEVLSRAVAAHGGNWERSHMTQLGGKFAGVVLVSIPEGNAEAFVAELDQIEREGLLEIAVESADGQAPDGAEIHLSLVGNDHPGIVHEVSAVLAGLGVSIDDLMTATSPAPLTGGVLFEATARLRLPAGVEEDSVIRAIEGVASDLMVDVEVRVDDQRS